MNWLDIVIIIALLVVVFGGLKNGLIKGVVILAGLIVGIVLAGQYYKPFAEILPFGQEGWVDIAAFVIILLAVMVVAMIAARLLRGVLKVIMLGWLDQLGGAVFGLIMAAFSWGAILAIWVQFLGPNDIVSGSVLAGFLLDIFPFILALLPEEFNAITEFLN
jgi:membrane protein required for colicin V production